MKAGRYNVTRSDDTTTRSGTLCDNQLQDGVYLTDVWLPTTYVDQVNLYSPWLGEVWL